MSEPKGGEAPFVTVAEIAEVLQLNQQTVRNWIDQGALPAIRIGRRVRVRREDYERLLQDGLSLPGTEPEGPSPAGFWSGELPAIADVEPPESAGQSTPSSRKRTTDPREL